MSACMSIDFTLKRKTENMLHPRVQEVCNGFLLTDDQIKQVSNRFLNSVNKGLSRKTHNQSVVKCFPTYVQDFPTGQETGNYLALDLGGTNFRVLLVKLKPGECDMEYKIYAVPEVKMRGTVTQLFDHIAECLDNFIQLHSLQNERLPLGFTFSFPTVQKSLTSATIVRFTKGFKIPDAVGKDVVEMLRSAIKKRGHMKVDVLAVLNDTTGTLMSCAWKDQNCKIGLIIGTGTNICYVEKVKNAEMFEGEKKKPYVVINVESPAFGDDGNLDFVRNEFDIAIDKASLNIGEQIYEKMISGMYMGELVRLVVVKLVNEKILFGGKGSGELAINDSFKTKFVSDIESDEPGEWVNMKAVIKKLNLDHATENDYANLRFIAESVTRRAAALVSAVNATLVNKMQFSPITLGVDGSVYRLNPIFHDLIVENMTKLVDKHIEFKLMLSEDGSGRGAALVAAAAAVEAAKTKI